MGFYNVTVIDAGNYVGFERKLRSAYIQSATPDLICISNETNVWYAVYGFVSEHGQVANVGTAQYMFEYELPGQMVSTEN
jgi:hypothetical protein